MTHWTEHQRFEAEWWGTCTNTFGEEAKQISYAYRMGLVNNPIGEHWPGYDLGGASVVDLGGGPTSLLLKCRNFGRAAVVDPCPYPAWVEWRYRTVDVEYVQMPAEQFRPNEQFDEAWMYNVLQHVIDPEQIIVNARRMARTIRVFEWVDIAPCLGHPHELKSEKLNDWLGDVGTIERMQGENACYGTAYYGVFAGDA